MLFNSIDFAIFLPVVFIVYWFITNRNLRLQNLFIVIASYFFYGWWDWRFLSLIFISTLVDYLVGRGLSKYENERIRRILLFISIFVNLGFLGFFKYYNFFISNFMYAFSFFGMKLEFSQLSIVIPVGISFYTFQTMSYTIDVYRRKFHPTDDFIAFFAFVSFFPQLVAGPIERARNLLPQFYKKRKFDYNKAIDGSRQILWGLFKKVVIADNCAKYVLFTFNNTANHSGSTLILGVFLFAIQIYCDFSGYSDIAIGVAHLFGFNLMKNFAFPYFSRDIAEFWRRWHISLTTWFRDYLYIPLGGSRVSTIKKIRNIFIIFIVSGFWHGANWTFIIWGILNALYFLPLLLLGKNRKNIDIVAKGRYLPSIKDSLNILYTFLLTLIAWVFFRAKNLKVAIEYLSGIFSFTLFSFPHLFDINGEIITIFLIFIFIFIEWLGREEEYALAIIAKINVFFVRYTCYNIVAILIIVFGSFHEKQFIYFQF